VSFWSLQENKLDRAMPTKVVAIRMFGYRALLKIQLRSCQCVTRSVLQVEKSAFGNRRVAENTAIRPSQTRADLKNVELDTKTFAILT